MIPSGRSYSQNTRTMSSLSPASVWSMKRDLVSCVHVVTIHLSIMCADTAHQAAVIQRNEQDLKTKLSAVEMEHQERLESLTNKCLAFEEELSEWNTISLFGTAEWVCNCSTSTRSHPRKRDSPQGSSACNGGVT